MRSLLRRALVLRLLCGLLGTSLLAGCRAPAAGVYTVAEGSAVYPPGVVLTGQLLTDTTVEIMRHPLRSAWDNLCEVKDHLAALAEGMISKRILMHLHGPPGKPTTTTLKEPASPGALGPGMQPAQVQIYYDGATAQAALYHVIDRARCRIDVLMFYWENDSLGADVAARLAARAGPDLHVRVLVDGGGNLIFGQRKFAHDERYNRVVAQLAQHPYVEVVRIRNPFARFDHRKLVLADGQLAWTGGRNFSSSAFFKHHDVSYTLAGPLVPPLQECFDAYWHDLGGKGAPSPPVPVTVARPDAYARLVATAPGHPGVANALYAAIDGARHHVYVENVYFSDSRLVCKLARARRRGVDVRAVLTFTSGDGSVDRANKVVANRLRAAGVRVYVYPIMTHVKAAAVDGSWVYLGTGNFDPLSLRHNHEMGLVVGAGPLLAEVEERLFQADFRPEWELLTPVAVRWCDYISEIVASLAM